MADPRPAVAWRADRLLLGAVYALPAVALTFVQPELGLASGIGAVPAAALGLAPVRRRRVVSAFVGAVAAAGLMLGAVLAQWPVVAVASIFTLSVAASVVAARVPIGRVLLFLCLPLVGAGLSFDAPSDAVPLAAAIVCTSVYAWLVSLLWPETGPVRRPPARAPGESHAPSRALVLDYGARLGAAAAIAATVGFALDVEHVGWACCAALLVGRPSGELVRRRGLGRTAAVLVGATAGAWLAAADPPTWVLAGAVLVDVALVAATQGSRWYITGGFTTFLVLLLLVHGAPGEADQRVWERVVETLLGVGLALGFCWWLPEHRSGRRRERIS